MAKIIKFPLKQRGIDLKYEKEELAKMIGGNFELANQFQLILNMVLDESRKRISNRLEDYDTIYYYEEEDLEE